MICPDEVAGRVNTSIRAVQRIISASARQSWAKKNSSPRVVFFLSFPITRAEGEKSGLLEANCPRIESPELATLNTSVADGTTVANTPSVTSSTLDPNSSNNSGSAGTATITAQNKSDLFVTTNANLSAVKSAGTLVYTVTVRNLGPFRAAAVTLLDPVPALSAFVSMNSGGASCTAPAAGQVGTITCNFGNMASGASASVTITVKVSGSSNKESITNTAVVSSPSFDPNPANNSATVTTQIFGNKK